jgi:hypothetical protein
MFKFVNYPHGVTWYEFFIPDFLTEYSPLIRQCKTYFLLRNFGVGARDRGSALQLSSKKWEKGM